MTNRSIELEATLRLALEALEVIYDRAVFDYSLPADHFAAEGAQQAITAIKEALANHIEDNLAMVAKPAVTESYKQSTTCGEPVAWVSEIAEEAELMLEKPKFRAVALYTTPPTQQSCLQRPSRSDIKPLTDEEFQKICTRLSRQGGWENDSWDLALKEAIEQAYGITASEAEDSARSKT